jgi:hypothetical protein
METMKISIPDTVEKKTVKAVLKALGVLIEDVEKTSKKRNGVAKAAKKGKPYNPEYVAMIEKSRQEAREGKVHTINLDELWK